MRVAALLPAATDMVLALGLGDRLVAVTHACALPGALSSIPRVTASRAAGRTAADIDARVSELSASGAPLFDLDEPALAAARPDVLLTQAVCDVCAVREEDARAVAARLQPPARVVTLGANTVDAILDDVSTVGVALDAAGESEELVAGLRSRMHSVHARLKAAKAPRPRVAVIEWTDPPFGAGHWVPDQVRRAGGQEVIGRTGEVSRRTSAGEVASHRPDLLIVAPCGVGLAGATRQASELGRDPEWEEVRSVPVWAIDANSLTSSPGPGVIRGIEILARVIHPEIFGPPPPASATRVVISA